MKHPAILGAALLCLLVPFARAEEELVVSGVPLTNKVVFLVDVSGSMTMGAVRALAARLQAENTAEARDDLDTALHYVREIVTRISDQAKVKFVAFGAAMSWYDHDEWMKLPDRQVFDAIAWYRSMAQHEDMASATHLVDAVRAVLELPDEDMSVVIISDCELGDSEERVEEIAQANAARDHGPVPIAVISVGAVSTKADRVARKIAEDSQSFYLRRTSE
ncbi:hypothetical protein ACFL59_01860 [Planctomycetota bacterium]